MHKEFDQDLGVAAPYKSDADKFDMYRSNRARKSSRYPVKSALTSKNAPNLRPMVQRNYVPQQQQRKRFKPDDLVDSGNEGSLWSQDSKEHPYLFTSDNEKANGDIVLIKVSGKLKNEITAELKRAFPSPRKVAKAGAGADAKDDGDVTKVGETEDEKIYDRISSVIIEEINKDHLLLRGRKNLLYKNKKRLIEVQALVTRRDIGMDDTVNSNRIIESAITVIR
tara:strand:+ start:18689 stop:19360 length:672 start_codon:yes stop_codon:yes gene_type:complete